MSFVRQLAADKSFQFGCCRHISGSSSDQGSSFSRNEASLIIHVNRKLCQKVFEVSEGIEIVGLSGFSATVDIGTGLRSGNVSIMTPVLFVGAESANRLFCRIVIHRHFAILQEIPEVRILVQAVLKTCTSFGRAVNCRVILTNPCKEGLHKRLYSFCRICRRSSADRSANSPSYNGISRRLFGAPCMPPYVLFFACSAAFTASENRRRA